jgi:D-serine dehydratase
MTTLLDGCYTIKDEKLYPFLAQLADIEDIFIEPSACASFTGPGLVCNAEAYLIKNNLKDKMENATHILWATGGNMVPEEEMQAYYNMGK